MGDENNTVSRAVDSEAFHQFIPGEREEHITPKTWDSLRVQLFSYPAILPETWLPPTEDHVFCLFGHHGEQKSNKPLINSQYKVNDEQVFSGEIFSGDLLIVPRRNRASMQWTVAESNSQEQNGFRGATVYLPAKLLEKTAQETLDMDTKRIELVPRLESHDSFLSRLACELSKGKGPSSPINRLYAETLTQMFTVHVLRHYCEYVEPSHSVNGLQVRVLNRVVDYMDANISNNLGLDELAAVAGLSTYYFVRLFKRSTGLSPHQYLVNLRIQRAKRLLTETSMSMLEIAHESGYASASNFAYAFRRIVRVTPSRYRQDHK